MEHFPEQMTPSGEKAFHHSKEQWQWLHVGGKTNGYLHHSPLKYLDVKLSHLTFNAVCPRLLCNNQTAGVWKG